MNYVLLVRKKVKMKMKKKNLKQENSRLPEYERPADPVLRFCPTAWAKLLFFRDYGDTEISGFGITEPDDLLYVKEFVTIKQKATVASISLDDEAVSEYFDSQVDLGRKPEQFFRIWCHSHPGSSPEPSSIDDETFQRVFSRSDWAVMLIVGTSGKTYARLRFNIGPGGELMIPVCVDYDQPFGPTDREDWEDEYNANIKVVTWSHSVVNEDKLFIDSEEPDLDDYSLSQDILEQLEDMEPAERKMVLDELAARPDLWSDEEVLSL
jgi:hypothetical protein